MTFLYWTLVVAAALVILYAAGYLIAFCVLFFIESERNKEHLIENMLYSLGSWFTVLFIVLFYALDKAEQSKDYD